MNGLRNFPANAIVVQVVSSNALLLMPMFLKVWFADAVEHKQAINFNLHQKHFSRPSLQ